MKTRYFDSPIPRIVAHRGHAAMFPENTMPAFEAAAGHTNHFELDVWWTADRVLAVHHDETMLRTCNDPRPIHSISAKDLPNADAGWSFPDKSGAHPWRGRSIHIPTLTEVFQRFPQHRYIVEIKHDIAGIEEAVISLAAESGLLDRILIASEHDAIIERARAACADVPTNMPAGEIEKFVLWLEAGAKSEFRTCAKALQIPVAARGYSLVKPELIKAAHLLGLEVHYWTINEPDEMRTLLDMGADALITDDPALARNVMNKPSRQGR